MGQVAVVVERRENQDHLFVVSGQLTFSSSYVNPTGDDYTPEQFGLGEVVALFLGQGERSAAAHVMVPVIAAKKIRVFLLNAAGTEPATTQDQSNMTVPFIAYGRGG